MKKGLSYDICEKIALDYGFEKTKFYGLTLREIEIELQEEKGALDRYLLREDD